MAFFDVLPSPLSTFLPPKIGSSGAVDLFKGNAKVPALGDDRMDPDRIRGLMQAGVGALGSAIGGPVKRASRFFSAALFGGVATKGALVDIQTRERLSFQFNPETISDEQQTEWASIRAQGMSHPRKQWVGGGDRIVSFTLRFYRESFAEAEVSDSVARLQSLMLPEYDGTRLKDSPHRCLFIFGTLYNLTCILTRAATRYYDLFSPSTLQPVFADIDVELTQFVEVGEDYSTRRMKRQESGGGFF